MAWTMLCLTLCVLGLGLSASAQKHRPTFITFDAPGVGTGQYVGTAGFTINDQGVIVGWVIKDANLVHHGFLRTPDGKITTIDAPGAGTDYCEGSVLFGLNPEGTIAGYYMDASDVWHGFLRALDRKITTFDAPGAGSIGSPCGGQGTISAGLNPAGAIAGWYVDDNWVGHGYVRDPHGKITTFDPPGNGTGMYQGVSMNSPTTLVHSINPAGEITGWYVDSNDAYHGFLRDPHGKITTFDAPGAVGLTMPLSINPEGTIVGVYCDENTCPGFLRDRHGSFTTFQAPVAGTQATGAADINTEGAITGWYWDENGVSHGFLRDKGGKITTIDFPGAAGTVPSSINSAGEITGFYTDADGTSHGFLRIP